MNAPALAVVPLVLVTLASAGWASPNAGGAPSVAASRKALEAARGDLAQAVQRIQKDPPSPQDLDAAHAAVNALKAAVDAGAENEQKDLDYAKAALTARKELRTQREYVNERRAKVYLHNHRRAIDAALETLSERARRVEDKGASAKEIEDARAAARDVRSALDEARQFADQDADFAAYLANSDARLARHEKAFEDRTTQLSVGKQRALLEEHRRALSNAMTALGKGASDAQFQGADRAASALAQVLEGGKDLEAKDKGFRAEADRARAELAGARKRMDELWTATGLARLKAEIEPAHKDLVAATKAARGKSPTEEQLAEERTAAFVVRKLLEKFQPEAARSQAFGQYVGEVRKTLLEVEDRIHRRGLDSAQAAVAQTLRPLERRAPTEEQFKEAETAQAQLEKVLAGITPDGTIAAQVAEARSQLQTARSTLAKRQAEVRLDAARAAVLQALKPIEKRAPTDEQFAEANTALTVLEKTLETVKTKDAAEAAAEARALLRSARTTVSKRHAEVSLDSAKTAVIQALRPLEKRSPTDEQFGEASTALTVLEKTLEAVQRKEAPEAFDDAKARLRDARAAANKRRVEVDVERQRLRVEKARENAAAVMSQLQQAGVGDSRVQEAEAAVKQLQEGLDGGVALTKKDREYAAYDREVRKRIAELNDRIARQKVVLAAGEGRDSLDEKIAAARSKLQAAKQPEATGADLDGAAQAVEAVGRALESGASLEEQDRGYAAHAAKARDALERLKEELDFARQAQALRRRTVEALAAGTSAADSAASVRDLRAQRKQYEGALAQFKSCEDSGAALLEKNRALAGIAVLCDGRLSPPKDVIGLCAERARATAQLLGKVEGLIAFEEGPKRAFELAKGLLAASKKSEALEQFGECIATGKILENRNPELKDRKFQVGDASMSLAELVAKCIEHRNALQPK